MTIAGNRHTGAACASRMEHQVGFFTKSIGQADAFTNTTRTIPLIQNLSVHQIAFVWLDYCVCVPFGPVSVLQKVLDAGPAHGAVEFTRIALIKKFTMLLANVLLIFFTVFDFHGFTPSLTSSRFAHCLHRASCTPPWWRNSNGSQSNQQIMCRKSINGAEIQSNS
ncbi:MAG: hypothetical protein ABFD97_00135 [Syntrophobacter sp.]